MNSFDLIQANKNALAMMSHTFTFYRPNASHPDLQFMGNCKVITVVINENSMPEIGLSASGDSDDIDIYPIDELIYQPVVAANGVRALASEAPCGGAQLA